MEPGWHTDPSGVHNHRYHDGLRWTDHVADNGMVSSDPLPAPPRVSTHRDEADLDRVRAEAEAWRRRAEIAEAVAQERERARQVTITAQPQRKPRFTQLARGGLLRVLVVLGTLIGIALVLLVLNRQHTLSAERKVFVQSTQTFTNPRGLVELDCGSVRSPTPGATPVACLDEISFGQREADQLLIAIVVLAILEFVIIVFAWNYYRGLTS